MPSQTTLQQIVTDYFRTECQRQLYFNLHPEAVPQEVQEALKAVRQRDRIARQLREASQQWQDAKGK